MTWQQLRLTTRLAHAEPMSEHLQDLGAVSVTFLDNQDCPQFEEKLGQMQLWPETQLMALFPANFDCSIILHALKNLVGEEHYSQLHGIRYELLEDKDWQNEWKQYFQPMTFGQHIRICPSWHQETSNYPALIYIDPGMAFGTGTHETTGLMLQWIDSAEITNKTVIDYGCGSGILAMAAAKLGAARVIGIDNDPHAVQTTRDNADQNHISESLLTAALCNDSHPLDTSLQQVQADIILANILANPLIHLAPNLLSLLKSGGELVLSGILAEQQNIVRAAYEPHIEFTLIEQKGDWIRMSGIKR